MPCQVGRNIYQLRKKNRELLEQLESNSDLLENKIKGLRNTTRSPVRIDNVNNDVLTSSTRRKHEMWNVRNNSSRVASSTLMKRGTMCPQFNYDKGGSDCENVAEKLRICNSKKIPTKRIRKTAHISKSGIMKKHTGQPKEKMQSSVREVGVTECYCSNMLSKHKYPGKSLRSPRKCSNKDIEQFRSSKYSKSPKNRGTQTNDRNTLSSKSKNVSEICSKCIGASHLLNYSPKSVFLRRMKEKFQKFGSEPYLKKQSEITRICNCDNTQVCNSDSDSSHSHHVSHLRSAAESVHLINNSNSHDEQDDDNINSGMFETDHSKANHVGKTCKSRIVAFAKKSKEQIGNCSGNIPVEPVEELDDKYTEADSKSKESVSKKNSHSKIISAKSSTVEDSKKCYCKKEIGGLCCCEVACTLNCGTHTAHGDASFSGALKSESAIGVGQPSSSDCSENKTELKMHTKIRCPGYDIIAGLIDNDRKIYAADPCTQQLEELSLFRRKHWFDCHAHPHGATTSESRPDSKECHSRITLLDGDPMQLTKDPCVRSFRLNQRLFPEMVAEVHGAECCVTRQGGSASPLLLPTERRLVTLPTVPQIYPEGTCETAKTPGAQSFPKPNIVIHDPTLSELEGKRTRKGTSSKHRSRQPVPSNSLALRFQKGIA